MCNPLVPLLLELLLGCRYAGRARALVCWCVAILSRDCLDAVCSDRDALTGALKVRLHVYVCDGNVNALMLMVRLQVAAALLPCRLESTKACGDKIVRRVRKKMLWLLLSHLCGKITCTFCRCWG